VRSMRASLHCGTAVVRSLGECRPACWSVAAHAKQLRSPLQQPTSTGLINDTVDSNQVADLGIARGNGSEDHFPGPISPGTLLRCQPGKTSCLPSNLSLTGITGYPPSRFMSMHFADLGPSNASSWRSLAWQLAFPSMASRLHFAARQGSASLSARQYTAAAFPDELEEELGAALGDRFSRKAAHLESHGRDESYHDCIAPSAVAFPTSTEEVSQVQVPNMA
jgi:hypothetical protein